MADKAVHVRGAYKSYGFKQFSTTVLQNLDMNVPVGSIYGLLGASGCGKTTLLTCVVGQRKLDSGELLVLGTRPGSKGSGVPGRRVGYMPQDLGLLKEFTVRRAMYYFGWICNMADDDIEERLNFLTKLLKLPVEGQRIDNLSGGQQRRVSLAVALVHSPELLVLDEPTVGLDPILRQSIWDYLSRVTLESNTTVVITTHYIEEARHANVIGLMRQGRLLAEDSPKKLLLQYECPTLEQVFLKLSVQQSKECGSVEDTVEASTLSTEANSDAISLREITTKKCEPETSTQAVDGDDVITLDTTDKRIPTSSATQSEMLAKLRRMKALLVKNYLQVLLNPAVLFLTTFLPFLVTYLLFHSVGGYPNGLHLAVSNQEIGNYSTCEEFESNHFSGVSSGCHFSCLSCRFLSRIDNSVAVKEYYTHKEDALAAVRSGHAIGAIHFSANFSRELERRYKLGSAASRRTLEHSEIQLHMDMSDQQLVDPLTLMFYEKYKEFASEFAISCNNSPKATQIPIQWNDPIYGNKVPRYIDFLAPKLFIYIAFCLATALSTALIISDKADGTWNRNLVSGVSLSEVFISHIFCQITLIIIGSAEIIFVATVIHGFQYKGSTFLLMSLVTLQGTCGLFYGFVISIIFNQFFMANFVGLGGLFPMIMLGGVMWPIEGMVPVLAKLCLFLPMPLANLAISNITGRGGDLTDPEVYMGFVSTLVWIVGQYLVCIIVLNLKKTFQ